MMVPDSGLLFWGHLVYVYVFMCICVQYWSTLMCLFFVRLQFLVLNVRIHEVQFRH